MCSCSPPAAAERAEHTYLRKQKTTMSDGSQWLLQLQQCRLGVPVMAWCSSATH
jgi:hypothetical protein